MRTEPEPPRFEAEAMLRLISADAPFPDRLHLSVL